MNNEEHNQNPDLSENQSGHSGENHDSGNAPDHNQNPKQGPSEPSPKENVHNEKIQNSNLSESEKVRLSKEFFTPRKDWPYYVKNSGYNNENIKLVPYKDENNHVFVNFVYVNPKTQKQTIVASTIWDNSGNPDVFLPDKKYLQN